MWRPRSKPLTKRDYSSARLLVHFWASWNNVDKIMDNRLDEIMLAVDAGIIVRSLDVDLPDSKSICVSCNILNIPALGFFNSGKYLKTVIGLRETDTLIEVISHWNKTETVME